MYENFVKYAKNINIDIRMEWYAGFYGFRTNIDR